MSHTTPVESPILVVMGVTGSGKSTVAEALRDRLGWDYAEGDAFHPQANIDKMASGQPLTDDDRLPWLHVIAGWIDEHEAADRPGIVTSSALKRAYRDILRRPQVVFVHLAGSATTIGARLRARTDHFMPPDLLDSQFAILEPPAVDERHLTLDLDGGAGPDALAATVIRELGLQGASVR